MFDIKSVETTVGNRTIKIETGLMARQAHGSVTVSCGDTVILATAVADYQAKEGLDFFPLTVTYQVKAYAAGKIPGGFFKREGRPPDNDTLIARLTDRPIRPLFPKNFRCETQVVITVLSHDASNMPDILGMIGASAALTISDIPFDGPMAAVRVGIVDGAFVINPTMQELETSTLDLVIAGTAEAVMMVESGSKNLGEDLILDAIAAGHAEIKKLVASQLDLAKMAGKPTRTLAAAPEVDAQIPAYAGKFFAEKGAPTFAKTSKIERATALNEVRAAFVASLDEGMAAKLKDCLAAFDSATKKYVRAMILDESKRIDGRGLENIRPINCRVGLIPRTHGSGLFTRGETQALMLTTLGTSSDEQLIDAPEGSYYKKFMLHYNFPPFSVGEARPMRSPGRREIGHGALAERALRAVLPDTEKFPYTIRLVSEVLESNGSSSMATVCGGSLAMMDAGVPITAPVAGIAMGLILDGEKYAILSDILGDEDHLGDMDFKVAGTSEGVTALQMDIKVKGITVEIMRTALAQAKRGRLHILGEMALAITTARADLSPYAPRITIIRVHTDKIRDVIGPGGKNIRKIIEVTQTTIDIQDDGTIHIGSPDAARTENAIRMIRDLTQEAEIGKIYQGTVRKIMDFGAFVEIYPGTDGLVHISEITTTRLERNDIDKYMGEGMVVPVKVLSVDNSGRIKLSRKAALEELGQKD